MARTIDITICQPTPAARPARAPLVNVSIRRVGGLLFIKVGRLCLSVCITKNYRTL